jgi:hypothetical protein
MHPSPALLTEILNDRTRKRHDRCTVELWRLHGATELLRALAIETSYGDALALELDSEVVLLHLQPDEDSLIANADHYRAILIAQGWQVDEQSSQRRPA